MAGNRSLQIANKEKNDEFYTQLTDIEKELSHYKQYFKGKTVFCNCDDPEYSNFWKFFQLNFYFLGLKKLIATHYETDKPSYKMEIVAMERGAQMGIPDYVKTPLRGNGDFRSEECVEILKNADMVVTNPPFSLFREYVAQLVEYKKEFIIIGNQNAITYKEIFPLLQDNKMWLGYNAGAQTFQVPKEFHRNNTFMMNEKKFAKFGNICWFTNVETTKRHENLTLFRTYDEAAYPKYDNYDAIEVGKVADIPQDYFGAMGVPITFLDKYNPEQFEIIGITLGNTVNYEMTTIYKNAIQHNQDGSTQGGSKVNTRAAICVREKPVDTVFYTADNVEGYLLSVYPRILIKRRKNNEN